MILFDCVRSAAAYGLAMAWLLTMPGLALADGVSTTASVPEGNVTFLDDLKETAFEVGHGTLGKRGATTFPSEFVQKFRLNGFQVSHALGVVPKEKAPGFVTFDLGGKFNRFRTTVALNRAVPEDGLEATRKLANFTGLAHSPVTFRVIGDGKVLWTSRPLVRLGESQECDVVLPAVKELRLETQSEAAFDYAWCFFANARVLNVPADAPENPPAPAIQETDVAFLDDLPELKYEVGYGKIGKHGATDGEKDHVKRFRLHGVEQRHTLSVHPSDKLPGYVDYELGGRYNRFRGTAALNVPTVQDGLSAARKVGYKGFARTPIYFRVVGDGKVLWESRPMQKHGESQDCDVSIAGVKQLHLEAASAREANFAWAFWANPRVFNGKVVEPPPKTTPKPADLPVASTTPKSPAVRQPAKPTPMPVATTTPTIPAKPVPGTPMPTPMPTPKAAPAIPMPTPVAPRETIPEGTVVFSPLDLGAAVNFMAPTEDGQYLVCSHLEANKVTVWDIAAGKIARTINTPAPRCLLCRGDTLFVSHATEGKVSSFSRKRNWQLVDEFAVKKFPIHHLAAPRGEYFKDEIIVTCHGSPGGIILLETRKDKTTDITGGMMASVSYDGKLVMTQSNFSNSPSGTISVYAYQDFLAGKPRSILEAGEQETPYFHQARPGLYWFGAGSVFAGVRLAKLPQATGKLAIPDSAQPVFYSLHAAKVQAQWMNSTLTEIDSRPVLWKPQESLDGIWDTRARRRAYLLDAPYARTMGDKLNLFVIDHKKGAVWSAETKRFVVPGTAVAAATVAPVVPKGQSAPARNTLGLPERISDGKAYTTKLTSEPKTEFELMKGPDGLTLSSAGELAWTPAKTDIGTHELKIRVSAGDDISIVRHNVEVVDGALIAKSGGSLAAADTGNRLTLEFDHYQVMASPDYRSLVLLQGDWLRFLGPDGLKVVREVKLQSRYMRIDVRQGRGSGEDTIVAMVNNPPRLDLLDGKTGKVRKSIPIQKSDVRVLDIEDYAVHPHRPVTFVTVKHDIELPRYRVLVIDEATGKIDAPEDVIATWVKVDPSGRYLFAAYRDLYTRGVKFHMNPGWNLISMPQYGNIDWLLVFEIRGQKLKLLQMVPEAGGNGTGIVVSPDAKRVTYLSHVGTPVFSGNLVGWNPRNVKEEPVTYVMKDRGTPKMLAYHPTLELVAAPANGSAVVFNRETGKLLEDKLQLTATGLGGATVEQILFSPDGSGLIFVCTDLESGRYLRRVDLKLTAAEQATAAKGLAVSAGAADGAESSDAPVATAKNLIQVKPDEIDALRKTTGAASLSSADISRRFLNSVVVINSDEGSGTGFVVGTKGYILTCAHVLTPDGTATVTYTTLVAGRPKTVTVKAKPVRVDTERDLALLKISAEHALTPVAMAEMSFEAGESVTVIGNPGLGTELLNHTVTTGVISSIERELDGQKFIQTSAAVNAGNSGGPVFGAKGQIVGLVVLKAKLEATAFAVPLSELRQFLRDATNGPK